MHKTADSKWQLVGALLLLASLLPSAYLAIQWRQGFQFGIYHDDGLYFVTAKSLAAGNGYRIESFPGEPHQTKYPPVYPLLLSAIWTLSPHFPRNLTPALAMNWLLLPVFLALAWHVLAGYGIGWRLRVGLCVLLALSPSIVFFGLTLMSEIPFAILLLAAVLSTERASERTSARWAAAAGVAGGLAYLTRSPAVLLMGTVPLGFAFRRQFRQAAAFLAAMLPAVVFWQTWMWIYRPLSSDIVSLYYLAYLKFHLATVHLADVPHMVLVNTNAFLTGIGTLLFFLNGESIVGLVLSRLVALAAIVGVVRLARGTGKYHYPLFALAYVCVLLVWHGTPGPRFLLPLAPLLLAGFAAEMQRLSDMILATWRKPETGQKITAVAVGALLALFGAYAGWNMERGLRGFLPEVFSEARVRLAANRRAWQWIRENTSPRARFLAYADPLLYLHTGRKALSVRVPPAMVYRGHTEEIVRFISTIPDLARRYRLDYAVLTKSDFRLDGGKTARSAFEKLAMRETAWKRVYRDDATTIFEIR